MIDLSNTPSLATASFCVRAADLAAAQRAHLRCSGLWLRTIVIGGMVAAALYGLDAFVNPRSTYWAHIIAAMAAAGTYLVLIVAYYALIPMLARRAYGRQPNLRHRWRIDLSEAGVRAVTPNQDAFVAWPDYVAWHEDRKVVLLYQSQRLFQFMPTSALSPEFVSVLRRLLAGLPKR